jgi:2-iminobutanoate/2-iminopropanoate deaminase
MAPHRVSLHVEGVEHVAPIPMGARVGNMVFSSGIMGKDPATGEVPDDAATQARLAFAHLKTLVENAGGTLADVGHVRVLMKDESVREFVNEPWLELFPDPEDRPARHAVVQPLRGKMLLQLEMIAVLKDAG